MDITRDQFIAAHAVAAAFYRVGSYAGQKTQYFDSPNIADFLRAMNPDVHQDYVEEKSRAWCRSPASFFAHLDFERRCKFVEWALGLYGADAAVEFAAGIEPRTPEAGLAGSGPKGPTGGG